MEEADDDPDNTLVELVNLIEDMLTGKPPATDDTTRVIEAARDITDRIEAGLDVPRADVTVALEELKTLFDQFV